MTLTPNMENRNCLVACSQDKIESGQCSCINNINNEHFSDFNWDKVLKKQECELNCSIEEKLSGECVCYNTVKDTLFKKHIDIDNILSQNLSQENEQIIEEKYCCPFCKSEDIKDESIRDSNGVLGHGYRSWVVKEQYSCNACGIMFKKVNKTN